MRDGDDLPERSGGGLTGLVEQFRGSKDMWVEETGKNLLKRQIAVIAAQTRAGPPFTRLDTVFR